jgi:L-lactate dehydrogenase complex protein LldF
VFHLVLLDNGRTTVLADEVGRAALRCIRCAACLNVCPVYERTGGHAYGSVYPGPIGAILTPQLHGLKKGRTLPWASSLCGACYDVCPVKIDIPRILVHLRQRIVEDGGAGVLEPAGMKAAAFAFRGPRRFRLAQLLARPLLRLPVGPLRGWLRSRSAPRVPARGFRDWWGRRG